jgi:alpha-glucosidase
MQHRLTGKPELPPPWAFRLSSMQAELLSRKQCKEITAKFRALKIPCDAIYLDIDYMEGRMFYLE